MIFLEQTFRPTTLIPDACGGRAANSHGEFNPGTQRKGMAPAKNDQKPREPSKMGGIWEHLASR